METKRKKRFFANHSKSSAMVVSLVLHAVLLVVALSFVAVTVVTKGEKKFESRQVNRPRLPPKKLQVPVKIKKQKRKPKLRQRIVVKTKVRNMPDIKMPEISGIKGGLGAAGGAGLGDAGSVGFSMPEIEVFGVRSRGEKIFIALDSDKIMLHDDLGGVLAYQIIKGELAKIIEGLSPTTLFNLAVFDHGGAVMLFPRMMPATRENVAKVEKWLAPLNEFVEGRDAQAYGVATLGKGGTPIRGDFMREKIVKMHNAPPRGHHWYVPAASSMQQQADAVFILSGWWGVLRRAEGKWPEWPDPARRKWEEKVKEGWANVAKENEARAARGEPPMVIRDDHQLIRTLYGHDNLVAWMKPEPEWYYFTGRDFAESIYSYRKESASKLPAKSGISKKKRDKFSVNVVYFAQKDIEVNEWEGHFEKVASLCKGQYRRIEGLAAIKSSIGK